MTPELPKSFGDERGVSPVVGVALLIAITVILAAVIGFVVLDTSTSTTKAKNARLDFDGSGPTTISHQGGDEFNTSNVIVKVNGVNKGNLSSYSVDGSTFDTGDSFTVSTNSSDTVSVVWDDPESDRQVQIGEAQVE